MFISCHHFFYCHKFWLDLNILKICVECLLNHESRVPIGGFPPGSAAIAVKLGGKAVGPTYGLKMEAVSALMGRDILEPKLDNLGWISFEQNCILC